ncbi:MAG: hypothetical protein JJU29_07000 [Verrucomicrobia bacterium]|nr:hypothetical protein [Verrucomicrobiota bacterium]MCH8512601.1 hypothetical protein [Kiritimatiellia bacterium]
MKNLENLGVRIFCAPLVCLVLCIAGRGLGGEPGDNIYPGIGNTRKQIEALFGPALEKQVIEYRNNAIAYKHARRFDDHILAVQVLYQEDRAVHLTLHRVSLDGEENLPWKPEQLQLLRAASRPSPSWRKMDVDGDHNVRFGGIVIYAPREVYVVEIPEPESWIVYHHIPPSHLVQIKHSDFYRVDR